jgi:hypothetical protein
MDPRKFGKILSLAASDNEAEALRALHVAKRMLDGAGLDFVDLAHLVTTTEDGDSEAIAELQERLALLRRENRQLRGENRRLRSATPASAPEGSRDLTTAERQLATAIEDAARLAAEVRRLTAAATHLRDELERSEHERYRLVAEARMDALVQAKRPTLGKSVRKVISQYTLF